MTGSVLCVPLWGYKQQRYSTTSAARCPDSCLLYGSACFTRVQIAGTPDQTLTALKMITDKLRASSSAPPDTDHRHHEYDRGSPVHQQDKRSRGEASGTCGVWLLSAWRLCIY